jgi:galactose mutarotase-like enzyme
MTTVRRCVYPGGASGLTMMGQDLHVTVLGSVGGNVVSIRDRRNGWEWMAEGRRLPRPAMGLDDWAAGHCAGWDECFPNIAAWDGRADDRLPSPAGWSALPDHGHLWSRRWTVEADGPTVHSVCDDPRLPYRFSRALTLDRATLRADYEVVSRAQRPLDCMYAAHPLFRVLPGMRLDVPADTRMRIDHAVGDPRVPIDGKHRVWPRMVDGLDRLDVVPQFTEALALKLFATQLRTGQVRLASPSNGPSITVRWDVSELPGLGLWLNYMGWPRRGALAHVGIEPCLGDHDELQRSLASGTTRQLEPGGRMSWSICLDVGAGAAYAASSRRAVAQA